MKQKTAMKTISTKTQIAIVAGTLVTGLLLGWILFGRGPADPATSNTAESHQHLTETTWTCSMHPQIRVNEPGKCPICGMDLVELSHDTQSGSDGIVYLSDNALKLANVQTTIVGERRPSKEVRLNGKVRADERRVHSQTSHISGRIERLSVNFTGEVVKRGQTLAVVYSPDLVTAQQELLEAYRVRQSQPALYNAAREKLKNWKLSDGDIDGLIDKGEPAETFPIAADAGGVVLQKNVNKGDYVQRGSPLYEIADLSHVWILLDLYESDIQWVQVGDKVKIGAQSLPGQPFEGKISYIDPIIDPQTRVASARVEIANPGRALKPGMFVTGLVEAGGALAKESLIVPKSAVMWTGERSVVYVKRQTEHGSGFEMRVVMPGPATGNGYVIKEGLVSGEEIVTNGAFTVDAAAQLSGAPSMMNRKAEPSREVDVAPKSYPVIGKLLNSYLALKDALVKDDLQGARRNVAEAASILKAVDMKAFSADDHDEWMKHHAEVADLASSMARSESIDDMRKHFIALSEHMIGIAEYFGVAAGETLYVQHCPMADSNKGADWLSKEPQIRNPYFGSEMLTCGEVTGEISSQ